MNIIAIVGLGITAAAMSAVMKRVNGEYSLFISLGVSLILLCVIVASLSPLLALINEITDLSGADSGHIAVLMKALAICYITGLASDCCSDAGESAIASKIEFAGKTAVLILSVPLIESILGIVKELII